MSIDFVISTTPLRLYIAYALPFVENPSIAQQGTIFGPTFVSGPLQHTVFTHSIEGTLFHERKNHIFYMSSDIDFVISTTPYSIRLYMDWICTVFLNS